uniref:V-type proton ATPase subunit a n=1 Tax=Oncorhynchus mykiss TaxID=8022 RepID=A0A8C7QNJ9_ONCMY
MGAFFRSEEVCLVQLFLQSGSAYNCVSELGELGLVEFRDLNPNVNSFQRKFVNEVRRCEEMEKTFSESLTSDLHTIRSESIPIWDIHQASSTYPHFLFDNLHLMSTCSLTPLPLSFSAHLLSLLHPSIRPSVHRLLRSFISPPHLSFSSSLSPHVSGYFFPSRVFFRLLPSFVAGVVHPWKVPSFERLLWRACRGYIIVDFREMEESLELPETGEMVQWTVFLISFWGEQIGQKVKKICDWLVRADPKCSIHIIRMVLILFVWILIYSVFIKPLPSLHGFPQVLSQTEHYLQQLLCRSMSVLPQWKVRVQKCKAVQAVLNLCSPSVTDKCLIAEAWCPVRKLLLLQSALIEGTRKNGSGVDSFYNRLPDPSTTPPTLFHTNSFTAGFQSIVDAYGVARYREVNPAVYTIITFPFLFAVMFGDVGHGLLMTMAALWMVLQERDLNLRTNDNEIWQMMFGGRYLILLMGLFSIYTGAVYNECFSKGLSPFPSGWHLQPMFQHYNWTDETLRENQYLTLDPNVTGVFQGPYPFGIDPIWRLANNHLTFLNSYKMKMSVIIGVVHMTFGVCLSFFNYIVFLVLIPELLFMQCLFGYLVFMVLLKWVVFSPQDSDLAPSILIHFIDMFLFTENEDNPPLYRGQMIVQRVLVVVALASVPVLLLGKPLYLYYNHRRRANTRGVRGGRERERERESERERERKTGIGTDVFMHQAIHTIEYCLGCISNTASYLRLWALSLAHAQLSEVLWVMVMRISLSWQGYVGSVVLAVIFSFFATLTVSILLVMEGLSAFLHALRLHWVEFQNKFYSGTGYKLNPFSFSSILNPV